MPKGFCQVRDNRPNYPIPVRSPEGTRTGCAGSWGEDRRPRVPSRKRGSRAVAGLRSRALRPGARSWLTGVAGPRAESAARTPKSRRTARRRAPRGPEMGRVR